MAIPSDPSATQSLQDVQFLKIDKNESAKLAKVKVEYQGRTYTVSIKSQDLSQQKIEEITHRMLALAIAFKVGEGTTKSLTLTKDLTQGVQLSREREGKADKTYNGASLEEILEKRKDKKEKSVKGDSASKVKDMEIVKDVEIALELLTSFKPTTTQPALPKPVLSEKPASASQSEAETAKAPRKPRGPLAQELESAFTSRLKGSSEEEPVQQPAVEDSAEEATIEEKPAQQERHISEQEQQPTVAQEKTEKQAVEPEKTPIEEPATETPQEQPALQQEPETNKTPSQQEEQKPAADLKEKTEQPPPEPDVTVVAEESTKAAPQPATIPTPPKPPPAPPPPPPSTASTPNTPKEKPAGQSTTFDSNMLVKGRDQLGKKKTKPKAESDQNLKKLTPQEQLKKAVEDRLKIINEQVQGDERDDEEVGPEWLP